MDGETARGLRDLASELHDNLAAIYVRLAQLEEQQAHSPWIPLEPDGLPPETYPAWRRQEQQRRV